MKPPRPQIERGDAALCGANSCTRPSFSPSSVTMRASRRAESRITSPPLWNPAAHPVFVAEADGLGRAVELDRAGDGIDVRHRNAGNAVTGDLAHQPESPARQPGVVGARPNQQRLEPGFPAGTSVELDIVDDPAPAAVLVDDRQVDQLGNQLQRIGQFHPWPPDVSK